MFIVTISIKVASAKTNTNVWCIYLCQMARNIVWFHMIVWCHLWMTP